MAQFNAARASVSASPLSDPLRRQRQPSGDSAAASQNGHTHHYHYHLYQTTLNEVGGGAAGAAGGGAKESAADEAEKAEEAEEAEMAALAALFPDGIPEELLDADTGEATEVVDEEGNVITVLSKPRRKAVKNILGVHDLSHSEIQSLTFLGRTYRFLHDPSSSVLARLWSVGMVLAIIASSIMILLQSMPNLRFLDTISLVTEMFEFASVVLFSVDYWTKLICVSSYASSVLPHPLQFNPVLRFVLAPINVVDFVSVAPYWVQLYLSGGSLSGGSLSGGSVGLVFRVVRMVRIVRLLKVAQYSRSIDIFFRVLVQAWDALVLLFFFTGFGCIVFGTLIFLFERGELQQDESVPATFGKYMRPNAYGNGMEESPFTSIPLTFWYVVATLTTVGYGDLYPTSTAGRLIGGVTMLSGVLFISTPLVIFGTHFQNEFNKELERIAIVHKRQEKIKKKVEEAEKRERLQSKEREQRRRDGLSEGEGDEFEGDGWGVAQSPLPGSVNAYSAVGEGGDQLGQLPRGGGKKLSVMVRGSRPSISGFSPDLSLRIDGSASERAGSTPSSSSFVPTVALGGSGNNGCTCACTCGARLMPGEGLVGGVRRSVFTKTGPAISQSASTLTSATPSDQVAVKRGMLLAQAVLPSRAEAERGAVSESSRSWPSAGASSSSADVSRQLAELKAAVQHLGGMLRSRDSPPSGSDGEWKDSEEREGVSRLSGSRLSATEPLASRSPSSNPRASLQPSSGRLGVQSSRSSSSSSNSAGPGASSMVVATKQLGLGSAADVPAPSYLSIASPSGSQAPASFGPPSPSGVSVRRSDSPALLSPTPASPLSVDQVASPARPAHSFPAPIAGEIYTACTRRLLKSLISTPTLSEHLLLKPPFRFLHDIVTAMMRERGFPASGFFDPSELDPDHLSDLESKLKFLEKLQELVSVVVAKDLTHISCRKIAAGLEAERTNTLLQEFARAAASGVTAEQITCMRPVRGAARVNAFVASCSDGNASPEGQRQVSCQVPA